LGRLVSILALVLTGAAWLPVGAQAAFGVDAFDVTFTNTDDTPATQVGSHPFAITTSLGMNLSGEEPDGRLRELSLEEIPGLVADTTAYPRCTAEDFSTLKNGVNACSLDTAVGISANSFGEPDNRTTAPVFNLAPPPGVLVRLGFRVGDVANVVADFGLSPEPPYDVVATIDDIPEAIEIFGLELQLWGDPANPAHDQFRGVCGVGGGGAICPVGPQARPLLTLPTSCEGTQATFYEALSWEGDEDFGSASTHDGAKEPMGFTGCGKLAFVPQASTGLTTGAAQSSTGLDVSIDKIDEGLTSVMGFAQSDIRDVVVALPQGMAAGASLTANSGCSEAGVEAETPDSAPGDGCPTSSEVGTAEVESPLLEKPIEGTVYRATPNENFADSAMALYVVLKNADLGIAITQPVALETDLGTGQLIAVAEEMPQLPFSDLHLHLNDGKGGPLISPPLCGEYETEAEFEPWAGEGGRVTSSTFQISSGPNGGPCPTGGEESHSGSGSSSGSSPAAPVVLPPPALHRHRCSKGKHLVRRDGKLRCVTQRHRKHKPHGGR
jgi:hypothetical protein